MALMVWTMKDLREVIEGCVKNKYDCIIFVEGNRGCLMGDTVIRYNRGHNARKITIGKLFKSYEKAKLGKSKGNFDLSTPTYIRAYNGKDIRLHKLKDVFYSGKQQVYKLILEDGKTISATSNHKFITSDDKWKQLKDLKKGDVLLCDTPKSIKNGIPKQVKIIKIIKEGIEDTYDIECEEPHHNFVANDIIVHNCGKSTFTYKLVSGLNIPMPFRPKRDIVFTREDVLKHLATKRGGCIFADEMINVSYNRDFYQEEQKTLLKALNMYRDSCNLFIGCIPKFVELDNQIKRLCKIRITVVRRGLALIQTQMPSIYIADGWDIRNNQKIESKWTLRKSNKPKYAQLTTVRGIVKFSDLSSHQREEYEAIKEEKRGRVFGDYQDVTLLGSPEKVFYQNLLEQMIAGKVTNDMLNTIATINGRDIEKIRNKLNNMLKEKGDKNRVRDYVMSKDKKEKKDKLGFIIKSSEQAFSMPELVPPTMQDKDEKPMQEPVVRGAVVEEKKEHKKIISPLLNNEDEEAMTQDILGFKG